MRIEEIHGLEKIGDVVSMVDTVDIESVRGLGRSDVASVGSSCVKSGAGGLWKGLMDASQEEGSGEDPEERDDVSLSSSETRVEGGGADAILAEDLDSIGIGDVMRR